ncbi:MAG: hypothetical protein HC923_04210 [Myxococcales bacterium]|nr:hypothetical protein [Myxococcales bacterium]
MTALAQLFLHPAMAAVFLVTIMSAVLSTIDSAILGPSTVLSENVVSKTGWLRTKPLLRNRVMIVFVASVSLVVARLGENAWALLEASYELGLVSLLVPMTYAVFAPSAGPAAALASMTVGTIVWTAHLSLGLDSFSGSSLPVGLSSAALAWMTFALVDALTRRRAARGPRT